VSGVVFFLEVGSFDFVFCFLFFWGGEGGRGKFYRVQSINLVALANWFLWIARNFVTTGKEGSLLNLVRCFFLCAESAVRKLLRF
jgi:hypothetical protein